MKHRAGFGAHSPFPKGVFQHPSTSVQLEDATSRGVEVNTRHIFSALWRVKNDITSRYQQRFGYHALHTTLLVTIEGQIVHHLFTRTVKAITPVHDKPLMSSSNVPQLSPHIYQQSCYTFPYVSQQFTWAVC